jgi:hypothetical protein
MRQHERERLARKRVNPVWRGVGCIAIVLTGLAGYMFSVWFLTENQVQGWMTIPRDLIRPPQLPWLPDGILVQLGVAILFMMLATGVVNTVYAIVFPIRPGETDAPQIKKKPPKSKAKRY